MWNTILDFFLIFCNFSKILFSYIPPENSIFVIPFFKKRLDISFIEYLFLKKDGLLVVVTFHSLEDKIVKYFFKSLSENKSISRYTPQTEQKETLFNLSQKKPIIPSDLEIKENPPSRSAKLRYAIKKSDFFNFDTDIEEKFKNFLEIEKLGDKL